MKTIVAFVIAATFFSTYINSEVSQKYILTGGPCAGKSSTLLELESLGEEIVHEAATDVCLRLIAKGINEPYKKLGFNEEILKLQQHRQRCASRNQSKRVIFDRSPVDVGVYYDRFNLSRTPELELALKEIHQNNFYEKTVFLLEQLNKFEATDVRSETAEEALEIERMLENEYIRHGFNVVRIPQNTVEKRAEQILNYINGKSTL
jgi:predicted ATPase